MSEPIGTVQRYYTRWARFYELLSARTPGVGHVRRTAIDRLDLDRGDVVVEMGCGTGANLPYLRQAVGPEGRVIGIDFTPGVLEIARDRIDHNGWENVHVVRADATGPPLALASGAGMRPDAVFASFVCGMFDDPAATVETWAELVGPGGRIGLMDLGRSSHPIGRLLNPLFRVAVRYTTPPGADAPDGPLAGVLDRRIAAAHRRLHDLRSPGTGRYEARVAGFVRISAGTIDDW